LGAADDGVGHDDDVGVAGAVVRADVAFALECVLKYA
jgi:hypothetical protein